MSLKQVQANEMFEAWPRATDEQRAAALAALKGETPTTTSNFPSILSAEKVAQLTNLTTRSLRNYARMGLIRPAYFSGSRKRAWGYSAESVKAFIERAVGA